MGKNYSLWPPELVSEIKRKREVESDGSIIFNDMERKKISTTLTYRNLLAFQAFL